MNRKILKQQLELLLKNNNIKYNVSDDKAVLHTRFQFSPQKSSIFESENFQDQDIFLDIYKKYVYFHLLGWEIMGRLDSADDIENFYFLNFLHAFFNKLIKVRINFSGRKPVKWEIFWLKDNHWQAVAKSKKWPACIFGKKSKIEFNIDDLKLSRGEEDAIS